MVIAPASDHRAAWAALRQALWPHCDPDFHHREIADFDHADMSLLALVAIDPAYSAIGLVEAALRHDYVNGCDMSPVAFVEGVFVSAGHRRRRVAAQLLEAVVPWALAHGCRELASDAGIDTSRRTRSMPPSASRRPSASSSSAVRCPGRKSCGERVCEMPLRSTARLPWKPTTCWKRCRNCNFALDIRGLFGVHRDHGRWWRKDTIGLDPPRLGRGGSVMIPTWSRQVR